MDIYPYKLFFINHARGNTVIFDDFSQYQIKDSNNELITFIKDFNKNSSLENHLGQNHPKWNSKSYQLLNTGEKFLVLPIQINLLQKIEWIEKYIKKNAEYLLLFNIKDEHYSGIVIKKENLDYQKIFVDFQKNLLTLFL